MTKTSKAEKRHARLVGFLRLVAALAWLVFAALIFEVPIREQLGRPGGPIPSRPEEEVVELPPSSDPGFMVEAVSVPAGGRLTVDGVDRGVVPSWINVACRNGQAVTFEVTWEGYPPWRREVICREGGRAKLTARLRR